VQFDCPDSVATYIHRVGRTARYRSGGKSLLFLLPSELHFIELLKKKAAEVNRVKADPQKLKDVTPQFASFLAAETELKFLAQKAFISYVRSVALQSDKEVFQVGQIPFEELAKSWGLAGTPKVKLPKETSTVSTGNKEKNMPHALRELIAEKRDPSLKQKRKEKEAAARDGTQDAFTAVDRILNRKNATVLAAHREKLRSKDDEDEADEGSDDEILRVARRDHDLSSEDSEDEEEMELSSESGEEDDDDEQKGDEEEPSASVAPASNKSLLRAELAKRQSNARGPQITPRTLADLNGADESDSSFLSLAAQRVKASDPQDRATDRERVRAKHLARKIAAKKAKRAQEEEEAADRSEEDDGVVVTLGRPDAEEEDEQERMQDDEDGDESADEQSADSEEEAPQPASKKRKGAASAAAPSAAAASTKPAKKQRTQTLAEQEALALKILSAR
jgi:ATP-dependent RNA helicase DDX10/DBP4